jgi:predicted  nucleic acid-binding Zn-ribbon protein
MFSQESKLAVLESKLGIYEDLSREMLSKLEAAVDKISEGNSRIATILAKHDERIEQSMKNDDLLIKMIDEMKEDNDKEHQEIEKKFERIESKLEEISRFRWQISAVVAFAVFLIGVIPTVTSLTTKASQGYNGSTEIQHTTK